MWLFCLPHLEEVLEFSIKNYLKIFFSFFSYLHCVTHSALLLHLISNQTSKHTKAYKRGTLVSKDTISVFHHSMVFWLVSELILKLMATLIREHRNRIGESMNVSISASYHFCSLPWFTTQTIYPTPRIPNSCSSCSSCTCSCSVTKSVK